MKQVTKITVTNAPPNGIKLSVEYANGTKVDSIHIVSSKTELNFAKAGMVVAFNNLVDLVKAHA